MPRNSKNIYFGKIVFHDYVNGVFLHRASRVTKYRFTGVLDVL